MQTQFTDLEGLITNVRDPGSRDIILEAVKAYRAGALRSAIILCWIAVFSDLIAKIRELGDSGNRAAIGYVDQLDKNIDNPQKMLQSERAIVKECACTFLILDGHDRKLFERLREDRNACAHPLLAGRDGHFTPTPELVRAHLAQALDRLLIRPPAQGKEALVRLWRDLQEIRLPSDWRMAVELLCDRYIEPGTETLRRAITRGAINGLLHREDPFDIRTHPSYEEVPILGCRRGLLACLEAVERVDQDLVDKATSDYIRSLEKYGQQPAQLTVLLTVSWKNVLWDRLSKPVRGQIKRMIESHIMTIRGNTVDDTVQKYLAPALGCVSVPDLCESLSPLIDKLKDTEFGAIVTFNSVPTELKEMLIGRFESVSYFRGAESLFDTCIWPILPHLNRFDINRLLDAIVQNSQIWYASGMRVRIQKLFSWLWENDRDRVDREKWSDFFGTLKGKVMDDGWYSGLRDDLVKAGIVSGADAAG